MPDNQSFLLFLAAALLVAVTPGPGIFYVAARALAGGRTEGLASSFGTGAGGFVQVFAGAAGISALVMASAETFTLLKLAGAVYLVWLGLKTWREAGIVAPIDAQTTGARRAFRDGILVEAPNPKTATFFLALIPQLVDPSADVARQCIVLGAISVALGTAADVIETYWAAATRHSMAQRPTVVVGVRRASGAVMCGLGASLLFARRTS
jgi:threonine/homoserine/homoserine lactone efflux protein